jgi:O-methyltransferase
MREALKTAALNFFRHVLISDRIAALALSGRLVRNFTKDRDPRNADLVSRFRRINASIQSATQWPAYIVMAEALLNLSVPGDVVECGCFKGASTAALSLVCSMVGRRLLVCDSFQGLPQDAPDAKHEYPHLKVSTSYKSGEFMGTLNEVKQNVSAYGNISVCEFIPGFFSDSLKGFHRPIAFAFFDVDLRSSMEDCIRNLWPCMESGTIIFTDDSCDMEVVKLWFDQRFWNEEMNADPPCYIGSGCGIPSLSPAYSSLGYTIKGRTPYNHVSFSG